MKNDKAEERMQNIEKDLDKEIPQGRIKKLLPPERETNFIEWQKVIKENFSDLAFPAEAAISIMAQILIKDVTNPFALVLVDVPSSGKTITINFFDQIEGLTYSTDKFTPASFVTGSVTVKKEDLGSIDLLPRLKYKMFLIRDLATLFSKRDDDLNESLGILTRVLDGEGLSVDTGTHGKRGYTGEFLFMILAASTPIPPRVWKMMGNLGSRLFFLNMNTREKTEAELVEQITTESYKAKESICRLETKNYLQVLWNNYQDGVDWDKTKDDPEIKKIISRCAMLLAKLRGTINVWKDRSSDGGEMEYTRPVIEKPDRINQLLYNMARGHALAMGRTQISRDDLKLIIELTIHSAPTTRADLFTKLLDFDGNMKTHEVEEALSCSNPTALKEMEALKILKVCDVDHYDENLVRDIEKTLRLKKGLEWFLSDDCKAIRGTLPPQELINSGLVAPSNNTLS